LHIKTSTFSFRKYSFASLCIGAVVSLVIASHPAAAQAPIGAVDLSGGSRGQGSNLSLQQLQEMDAVRREMSELRNLIERQGYEFNQYKRKSDQEILALREQLRALQGGLGGEGISQTDGIESGFSLGGPGDVGELGAPSLNNSVSDSEDQTSVETVGIVDEEPDAAMIGVTMGRYGQSSTATSTIPASDAAFTPAAGPQTIPSSSGNSANGGYQQIGNNSTNVSNVDVVVPSTSQPVVAPVTVEVVPTGSSVPINQPSAGQLATGNENLNASNDWQVQNAPNGQSGAIGASAGGVVTSSNQQPVQTNASELQWQVIRSPGPSSAPLDDPVTGSQIDQSAGIPTDSIPSQTQPSTDSVLGDL
jgi:hypothetical protein